MSFICYAQPPTPVVGCTGVVCGTGHRPDKLHGYSSAAKSRVYTLAVDVLLELDPFTLISGMALGWDQALASAAWHLGIPFVAAVPFKGFDKRWPTESRLELEVLLNAAEKICYVDEDPVYAIPWLAPGEYDPAKLQQRNKWMVDRSQKVLALWNSGAGGTFNCVEYAGRVGRPVVNYRQRFLEAK